MISSIDRRARLLGLLLPALAALILFNSLKAQEQPATGNRTYYLPVLARPEATPRDCSVPGSGFGAMSIVGPVGFPSAATSPETNLGFRGYAPTTADLSLVVLGPVWDVKAPQFPGFFADRRTPVFSSAHHRYRWDSSCNCPIDTHSRWGTTVLGMATTPGEVIHVPTIGYDIGGGKAVMALYVEESRITFHVGNRDNMDGYVIYVEDVCVDPDLLALYRNLDRDGREELPVLRSNQPFGRALGVEIKVAIRDNGSFLDPRSRNDWWQGR